MAPTKETIEATTNLTAVSPAGSRARISDRLRADAVSLEVPVKIHGTRVNSTVPGDGSSEAFEEKASTMIVFSQGGVLKMSTPVTPSQMIVITNLKSGHDSICRVVKVRAYAQGQSYVEIEFTHRQPGYWGVYFPSDGADAGTQVATEMQAAPAAPISVEIKVDKPAEKPAIETAPLQAIPTPPGAHPAASKPDSVFAPIGSQEEVQPPAAATSPTVASNSVSEPAGKPLNVEAAYKSPLERPAATSASPTVPLSIGELKATSEEKLVSFVGAVVPGDLIDAAEAETTVLADDSATPLARFEAAATLGTDHASARQPFGSGLGSSTFGIAAPPEVSRAKGRHSATLPIAAVAILSVASGAAYYFHFLPFGHQSEEQSSRAISAPAAPLSASAGVQPTDLQQRLNAPQSASAQVNSVRTIGAATTATIPTAILNSAAPSGARTTQPVASVAMLAPAEASAEPSQKRPAKAPSVLAAMKSHPKVRKHSPGSAETDEAPEINAPEIDNAAALPAVGSALAIVPPPGEQQTPVRIRVGGALKPPRLVSSVQPVFPAMARNAGIEGDVVMDTTIDRAGNVTNVKIVSGPPMLRQAALDALRQWKYEPSQLNGEPVPVQVTVTIKFHRG